MNSVFKGRSLKELCVVRSVAPSPNSPGCAFRNAAGRSTGGGLDESLNFAYLIRAHPRHRRNLCSKSFATVYINQIALRVSRLLFPAGIATELGIGYIVGMVKVTRIDTDSADTHCGFEFEENKV